ncbi:hypothetical protein [Spirosoma pollinicola]|uniref:Uncharacterized protein n=1 Tax=Spirosoma pollinicola TaxID=2057025 RepID=A0A2K8Z9H8_9BACT|nr:hypothetical protein [Spirosoma pollinicola]AUD06489.1 hypothetical protein CWM47_34380 [Spirosoma pollinicola]
MKIVVSIFVTIFVNSYGYAQSPNKKTVYTGTKVGGTREGNGVSAWSDIMTTSYIQFRKDSITFVQDSLQRTLKKTNGERKNK